MKSRRLINGRRVTLAFVPLHLAVGLSLTTMKVGKYPQDQLRFFTISIPLFCLTLTWRPKSAIRAAINVLKTSRNLR